MPTARPATITSKQVATFLKPRPKDSHKGLFGTVTVIGGAEGMLGAALLAGRASLKMGAGCVHVGLLADKMPMVDMRVPELMLHPAGAALASTKPDVLVIGCGLGRSLSAQKLLYDALLLDIALVVDADALNLIAQRPDLRSMLHGRKAPAVFTPHPGEAAHLLACSTEDIQKDRAAAVRELARRLNGSVVLKGAGSLCATRGGKLHINQTGNPGMSSAGMGDVLSGMIAAFIAQGLDADEALLLAVHLHGAAGDELAKQQATLGMSATEVTEWARWLLNRMAPK
ncbi:NAD(P)H-hydrate dehydratase [Sideroxydans sp. CL21]|uniref:NAD(P)H-hydrate dehydratase n=1 Tax=Sideroxydans sp. CL21 TaxID=2600596 RepID=UPI0024BC84B7|nr:NAD(P)H-hydrate dehydratase [Sideroxydans sp. CL21]